MPKRILIYSPYGGARCHTSYEVTIAASLMLRGADVRFICCDELFPDCDAHWASTHPRDAGSCQRCMQMQNAILTPFGFSYEWLSRYLDDTVVKDAHDWVASLSDDELFTATYNNYPLGAYAKSSVHSHFRTSELNVADSEVNKAFRNYLYGAVLSLEGMSRIILSYQPDILLMFNGRFFTHRTVLELARNSGLKVYVHERGRQDNSLTIWENESCHGFATVLNNWRQWEDVPLTGEELAEIDEILRQRREGVNTGWHSFVSSPLAPADLLAALGIPAGRQIITLFTSSEDEFAAFESRNPIMDQFEWIERTVRFFARKKKHILVVRLHPNTFPGDQFLMKINLLKMALPNNVRIVMPEDKINSYQLAEISHSSLFFLSRMAAEVAVRGKPVMICGNGLWYGHKFSINPPDAETYEIYLDQLITEDYSLDRVRSAYRFAYHYYVRTNIPFPLVSISDVFNVKLAYETIEQLRPGKDEALDRICQTILYRRPLYSVPGGHAVSSLEEEGFLRERERLLRANPASAGKGPDVSMPERILFVCHSFPPYEYSGTPLITLEQAAEMRKRGLDVAVLVAGRDLCGSFKREEIDGITVYMVPAIDRERVFFDDYCNMTSLGGYLKAVGEIIDGFSPDVVHINDAVDMPPVVMQYFADRGAVVVREVWNDEEICFRISPLIHETKELCSGPETPEKCEICFYKSPRDSRNPPFFLVDPAIKASMQRHKRYIRYLYTHKIDGVVFSSASFKGHFTEFVPIDEGKTILIPHGTAFAGKGIPSSERPDRDGEPVFSFMGNFFDYRKGLEFLLDAFDQLSHRGGFRLAIYGEGLEGDCQQRIERLRERHGEKIQYRGPYHPEEIPSIMAGSDVGIIPSLFESYSRVLREYLVHGVPVIATEFFGSEIVIDGYNGFKVRIGDSANLRMKMEELIDNPALLAKLTSGARQTPLMTAEDEAGLLLDYYSSLLTAKAGRKTVDLPAEHYGSKEERAD